MFKGLEGGILKGTERNKRRRAGGSWRHEGDTQFSNVKWSEGGVRCGGSVKDKEGSL